MVFVDHAVEYLVASDRAVDGHGGWPVVAVGGVLVESLVRTMAVVVPGVRGQDPGGVVLVVDQDAVGGLGADGAHEPLGITVRTGSARRGSVASTDDGLGRVS